MLLERPQCGHGSWSYDVDLQAMTQTNTETNKSDHCDAARLRLRALPGWGCRHASMKALALRGHYCGGSRRRHGVHANWHDGDSQHRRRRAIDVGWCQRHSLRSLLRCWPRCAKESWKPEVGSLKKWKSVSSWIRAAGMRLVEDCALLERSSDAEAMVNAQCERWGVPVPAKAPTAPMIW